MSDTSPAIQRVEDNQDPPIALPPLGTDSELLKEILKLESVELQPYGVFGRAAKNRVNDVLTPLYYGMESVPTQASFEGNIVLIPITGMLSLMADRPQIRDAKMRNKVIADTKRDVKKSIDFLEELLTNHPDDRYCELVRAEVAHREEILARLGSEEGRNRWDVRTGRFATGSNGVTWVNSVWQTASDVFLLVKTKSLSSVTPVVATAAHAASIAGGILNPISAIFIGAVARSAYFQSIQNAKEFHQGKQKIIELLDYLKESSAESRLERIQEDYQNVLNAKLSQRETFQHKFKNWNAGFVGGSLLYGVSAVAKTAIAVAALAGAVAVAANPVGAGILLGVGIAGAVAVSVGYQQFYYRRRKQKRYDAYRTGGDPILDRDFLNRLERHYSNEVKNGFQIRAEYYDLIHTGESKRQELLAKVAGEEQKKYKRIHYSTDKEYASGVRGAIARTNIPGFRSELTASFHGRAATIGTFARTGDWQKAREKGREVRSERCEHLTSFRLETWLRKEQNLSLQIEFMQEELQRQLNYLNKKIDLRFDIYRGKKSKPDPKLDQLIEKIDSGFQRDVRLREERDKLCKDLETVKDLAKVKKGSGSEPEPETEAGTRRNSVGQELERLRKEFVEVQGGATSFAKHLLNGEERFRNGRGQLIAVELDLAGQRPEVRSATDSPDQGVSEKGRRAAEVSTGSQPPPQSKQSEHLQQGGSNTITPITRESSGQETPPLQGPTALESVGGPPLPLPDSTNSNQPLPAAKVLEELNRRGSQDSRRRSQEEQARAGIGVG